MESNKTYWSSGLLAVNPEHIGRFDGTIVRTIFRDDMERYPTLFVTIKRDADSLESTLGFCYNVPFMDGYETEEDLHPSREKMLKPINEIYEGFEVRDPAELVGKPTTALYYNIHYDSSDKKPLPLDHIIGIMRR
jgi:hypothetical protein